MAQAVFALSEGKSSSKIKSAYKYAQVAANNMKSDKKVQEFFSDVKQKYDEVIANEQASKKQEESKEESKKEP